MLYALVTTVFMLGGEYESRIMRANLTQQQCEIAAPKLYEIAKKTYEDMKAKGEINYIYRVTVECKPQTNVIYEI